MGNVLAMNAFCNQLCKASAALALTAGLYGCGDTSTQPLASVVSLAASALTTTPQDTGAERTWHTPSIVAGAQEPFILVALPARDASATLRAFAQINGKIDWRGNDGISIVIANDVVVATRGLGADLFLAEASDSRATVADQAGLIRRSHSWLDGENRAVGIDYGCTISVVGREPIYLITRITITEKISETCREVGSETNSFTNNYWVGVDDGVVWQSRQWISDPVGYILIQHIKR